MAERHADERIQRTGTAIKRRGILAAAGAVVGIVARQAAERAPVAADGGTWTMPYDSGPQNTSSILVTLTNNGDGYGLFASSGGIGILGTSGSGNAGVYGQNTSGALSAVGVYGDSGQYGYGVYGTNVHGFGVYGTAVAADGIGVHGDSAGFVGVRGQIRSGSTAANAIAVQGVNQSTGAGSIGVQGQATGAGGIGVYGSSGGGPGVFGTTTAAQNAGLAGLVSTPGTAAFAGTSTNPNAFAGFFTGDVSVNGNFTVLDPTRKHGAIAHPDGSHRILYSMESPESWLEDFGEGRLLGGKADVRLDPDFAAVVHADAYHVFLTPYEGVGALRAVRRTAARFAVEEIGGASGGAFSYRVVAKPKTENKAVRLAKFAIPDIKVPQPPAMPNVSVPPVPENPPQAAPPPRPAATATTHPAAQPTVQPAPPPRP